MQDFKTFDPKHTMLLYWAPFSATEPIRLTQDMMKLMTLQQLLVGGPCAGARQLILYLASHSTSAVTAG